MSVFCSHGVKLPNRIGIVACPDCLKAWAERYLEVEARVQAGLPKASAATVLHSRMTL